MGFASSQTQKSMILKRTASAERDTGCRAATGIGGLQSRDKHLGLAAQRHTESPTVCDNGLRCTPFPACFSDQMTAHFQRDGCQTLQRMRWWQSNA